MKAKFKNSPITSLLYKSYYTANKLKEKKEYKSIKERIKTGSERRGRKKKERKTQTDRKKESDVFLVWLKLHCSFGLLSYYPS